MTDLFLIAHKVRGEAAFDVAERMRCPECNGVYVDEVGGTFECAECDEGYWWIISSFGHRARPYWWIEISDLGAQVEGLYGTGFKEIDLRDHPCPSDWPDLFAINNQDFRPLAESRAKGQSLLASLGLTKPKEPIKRRL